MPKPLRESKLSVITPVYKNEGTIEILSERVLKAATPLFGEIEHIFVNDASPDGSRRVLQKMAEADQRIKVINFTRNFGQHTALMTGLRHTTGEYIFFIDGDLEEDPGYLKDYTVKLGEGYEIVVGKRINLPKSPLWALGAHLYAWLHNLVADYKIHPNTTAMCLLTRRYADYLVSFSEKPFIAGFTSWIGLPVGLVPVVWQDQHRRSGYSWKKRLRHGRAGLVGFSTRLVRLALGTGLVVVSIAFIYEGYVGVRYWVYKDALPGFTSIVTLITFLLGLQFIFLGVLGEYVIEIFLSVKRRPETLIYDKFNL